MEGGARVAAMGGAATATAGDAWGQANPASWATLPGRAVSFFATQAFGLSELRLGAMQVAEVTAFGTISAGARTFGFDAYRETRVDAGFARGFRLGTSRTFNVGMDLQYHHVSIPDYGSGSVVGIRIGWMVQVAPSLQIGFQASNPHAPRLASVDRLPRSVSMGAAYRPSDAFLFALDAYKDMQFPLSIRGGVEVSPLQAVALRAGASTHPTRFTGGLGVRLGKLVADVAGEHHAALGWSPAVSFGLQW